VTRVLTIGTFDPPHLGHANLLRQARAFGDHLTVGVNSDAFVETYRGRRPVYSESERLALLAHLADAVLLNDGPGRDCILAADPDVLVVGSDWLARDYLAQIDMTAEDFADWGLSLVFVPRTPGVSSTDLKARLS